MQITYRTALEIASHEAIVRSAYLDTVANPPIWTWSIGITHLTGHDVKRYIGKPQTLEHCLRIYVWALETRFAPAVRKAFAGHTLTEAQFAAALSFNYNTGGIARAAWVKKWKAGDIAGARKSFMNWSKPKAIIPRRQKERDLFFDGKWSNDGTILEFGVTSDNRVNFAKAKRINIERELRAALAGTSTPPPTPTPKPAVPTLPHATIVHRLGSRPLQMGDQGADVAEWQNLLNELGYELLVDTHFGEGTRAATWDRQRHAGRPDTGVVDLELIADTRRAVAERKAAAADAKAQEKGAGKGAIIGVGAGAGGVAVAVDQGITTIDRIKNLFSPEVGGAVVMFLILALGALALWWFVIKPRRATRAEPTPREVREVDAAAEIFRARQVYAAPVHVEAPVETEPDDDAEAA